MNPFFVPKTYGLALGCRDIDDSTFDPIHSYLLVETQQEGEEGGRRETEKGLKRTSEQSLSSTMVPTRSYPPPRHFQS